ncbi:MAG: prolipoprotein diacylglyceryl transferase [Clostridiales bacterium]|jgi:phosphatidylglycerol:prolipoprotein diacylglycerol transferase|nr:prolipoprotein diacylglyceryl transferase [Clostridiales bacterium]
MADIIFPNLGISIDSLSPIAFTPFGLFGVYWYAIFVVIGIVAGVYFGGIYAPKKTGQDTKIYENFAFWVIPAAILGGRLFYVIFADWQPQSIIDVFNLRLGGIGIWGVIITAVAVAAIYCRRKKISFWNFMDTGIVGLIIGHVIGRFGNFTNREAFGGVASDSAPFAMQLRVDQVRGFESLPEVVQNSAFQQFGLQYIQVHPVFFYEAAINLALFIFLNFYRKHKKFNGELVAIYFLSYGITRFFLEFMRVDPLMVGNVATAHILSAAAAIFGLGFLISGHINRKKPAKKA